MGTPFLISLFIFAVVVAWIVGRSRNKCNTVLLIGLSDAGKTLMFSRVCPMLFILICLNELLLYMSLWFSSELEASEQYFWKLVPSWMIKYKILTLENFLL